MEEIRLAKDKIYLFGVCTQKMDKRITNRPAASKGSFENSRSLTDNYLMGLEYLITAVYVKVTKLIGSRQAIGVKAFFL